MGAASDLFFGIDNPWTSHGNEKVYDQLVEAANLWRDSQPFSAAVAMSLAVNAAWGRPDRMFVAHMAALDDFEAATVAAAVGSPEMLAAAHRLRRSIGYAVWLFDADPKPVRTLIRELGSDMAQRLLDLFRADPNANNYLVRGIVVATDLDGQWEVSFPDYEVQTSVERFGSQLVMNLPSAFHLLVENRDWLGADAIVEDLRDGFTSPGLRGWRDVTRAHVHRDDAAYWFDQAADHFAADEEPSTEELYERGSWSGINQQMWAGYFRARARVVEAVQKPDDVSALLTAAAESIGSDPPGWWSDEVARFRVLVNVLAKLVSSPEEFSLEEATKQYRLAMRLSEELPEDGLALRFLEQASAAFEGFRSDPASEMTRNRLEGALNVLHHIPSVGPEVASAVRPAIGRQALSTLLGPVRTWVHRTLESITQETTLQKLLLRLFQGSLPRYAQVLHGPLEFGKDIAVLVEGNGGYVLRLYQLKCGDITKKKWRESKDELEEMFLLPLSHFQLPHEPDAIEGILATNGHASPFVEPVMEAWFADQNETHGRDIVFMHLDHIVDWIFDHSLVNELRAALAELDVPIVGQA